MSLLVDVTFDFRSDVAVGRDPDAFSLRLAECHRLLWGRVLPGGQDFRLSVDRSGGRHFLRHDSELGVFEFSSDNVIPTFTRWKRMQSIVSQVPEVQNESFRSLGYTIGGAMIWPKSSGDGLRSINVLRGFNSRVADRMDLTLECVRLHYLNESHPLKAVFHANSRFFELFQDFDGFVNHFLLQDLVDSETGRVKFFLGFDDFEGGAVPKDLAEYLSFRENSIRFVQSRNLRIQSLVDSWMVGGELL